MNTLLDIETIPQEFDPEVELQNLLIEDLANQKPDLLIQTIEQIKKAYLYGGNNTSLQTENLFQTNTTIGDYQVIAFQSKPIGTNLLKFVNKNEPNYMYWIGSIIENERPFYIASIEDLSDKKARPSEIKTDSQIASFCKNFKDLNTQIQKLLEQNDALQADDK